MRLMWSKNPTFRRNIPLSKMQAPIAAKKPKELTIHGHTRIDNYFWMNERGAARSGGLPACRRKCVYRLRMAAPLQTFRENLFLEMKGRIKETDMSVPYLLRGYWYYLRTLRRRRRIPHLLPQTGRRRSRGRNHPERKQRRPGAKLLRSDEPYRKRG